MVNPRVVVTGLGAVTPFGWGVAPLRAGLRAGATALAPSRHFDTSRHRTRVAGEVPPPPAGVGDGFAGWDHLSRADQFALAAAREACGQAGLDPTAGEVAVLFGGSTGGMLECEHYVARLVSAEPGRPRLALVASQQINSPGDAVARAFRTRGPVATLSSACASGGLALGAALDAIRSGEATAALAGGADELCHLTYAGFNALRSVDQQPCRPFRADRAGLSIGEGGAVLVLETLDRALARGARPLAELVGWGASCDAHHMTAPHPEGVGAAAAITAALTDAGRDPSAVTFVNAHGTGTLHNDSAEARALVSLFAHRARSLPVTATKAAVGHLLGSSGAIEALATVLALLDGAVQPTPGEEPADPDLGVDLVIGQPRSLEGADVGLSTSFAFGGANAALLIAAWSEHS